MRIALIAAVMAGLWWLAQPAPVEVEAASLRRGELLVGFREEARTRAREPFLLSAPVAGQIDRITLEPGDVLEAGQVLVRLRPAAAVLLDDRTRSETRAREAAARAARRAAQQQVQALEAELQQARRDAERLERMPELVALAERDRARSRVRTLDAQVQAARAEVQRAGNEAQALAAALSGGNADDAGLLELRSPIAGRLLLRHVQSAQPVSAGQALLELAALDDLEVEAEVLSADAVTLSEGGEVRLSRWGGDLELLARVRRIDPQGFRKVSALGVEEQRTRVYLSFDSPPEQWRALGVGYAVEAWFVRQRLADTVLAPGSAILRDSGSSAVYVIAAGRAQRVPVQVLGENDAEAAISGELQAGQQVVAHPDDRVSDGVRLRVIPVAH
jgi:HlyD family secretion protein